MEMSHPYGFLHVWIVEKTVDEVRYLPQKVTEVSHIHPEGLKTAESIAFAFSMARNGCSISQIHESIVIN
jgi:type I restriction enzyme M protein